MKRWIAWLTVLVLVAALASCRAAKPVPDREPAKPQPEPEPPAAVQPAEPPEGCQHLSSLPAPPYMLFYSALKVSVVQEGTCGVETGEGITYTVIKLPASLTEAEALAGVVVEPADALEKKRILGTDGEVQVEVWIKAGKPGDRVTVRWRGQVAGQPKDLRFAIERKADPKVSGEIRLGTGAWQPWTDVMVLPPQPLSFRFQATGGLPPDEMLERVKQALGSTAAMVGKTGEDTLTITVAEPPSVLFFDFSGLHAPHATVPATGFAVYSGEEPRLVWLDPATGQEQAVGRTAPDLYNSYLSPDGKWALLITYGPSMWQDRIYVMNLSTGETHLTPFIANAWTNDIYWRSDRVFFGAVGRMQVWHLAEARAEVYKSTAILWGLLSKDGRYLPGFTVDGDREDPATWLAPATVVLFDVLTGTERTFPDLVKVRVPHSSKPYHLPMAWAEDGSYLRLGEATGDISGPTGWRSLRFDPATGVLTSHDDPLPDRTGWVTWEASPAGWQLYRSGGWGPVRLKAPDGQERQFGEGLAVGWAPDGRLLVVRWPISERRIRHGI